MRIEQAPVGGVDGHRVDREVAACEVLLHIVAESYDGLARVLVVALGAVGGYLEGLPVHHAADRAEPLSLGPQRRRHTTDDPPHRRGASIGGAVQVGVSEELPGDSLAHDAANEVQPVPGRCEEPRHAGGGRQGR